MSVGACVDVAYGGKVLIRPFDKLWLTSYGSTYPTKAVRMLY